MTTVIVMEVVGEPAALRTQANPPADSPRGPLWRIPHAYIRTLVRLYVRKSIRTLEPAFLTCLDVRRSPGLRLAIMISLRWRTPPWANPCAGLIRKSVTRYSYANQSLLRRCPSSVRPFRVWAQMLSNRSHPDSHSHTEENAERLTIMVMMKFLTLPCYQHMFRARRSQAEHDSAGSISPMLEVVPRP